jgi:ribonuclease T2
VRIRIGLGAAALMMAGMALAQDPAPPSLPLPPAAAGWTLSFSWSPEFCKRNLGSKELQCLQEHYFVLSGLAPRFEGHEPACQEEGLPRELLPRALDVMHNEVRLKKTWRTQGACTGLGAGEYVLQLERAQRRLSMPELFRQTPREGLQLSQDEFRQALARDNPGLQADAVALQCRGGWLESIDVCVDHGFGFQACPAGQRNDCPDPLKLRPIRPVLRSDRGD